MGCQTRWRVRRESGAGAPALQNLSVMQSFRVNAVASWSAERQLRFGPGQAFAPFGRMLFHSPLKEYCLTTGGGFE